MATKKSGGSSRNGRNSSGKRLGFKKFGGGVVKPGNIILKQRGNKFVAGLNVNTGKNYTLFATNYGQIILKRKNEKYKIVNVI